MKRRIPKRYIVLISCTDKAPITFSFHPLAVIVPLAIAIVTPIAWVGMTLYSHSQRNLMLTEEAADVLQQLNALDAEVKNLRERAGLPRTEFAPTEADPKSSPQGGTGTPVEAEELLETANSRLPALSADLKQEIEPALENTLLREAARPTGIPLKVTTEISSPFGLRRNPFGRRSFEFHQGLDFTGAYGSPVHVTAPGTVEKAEWSGGYGYHVVVNHGYGYRTLYAHLSKLEVSQGAQVNNDQIVGYLGSTGRSSGPHLHYSVYRNGTVVDPQGYLD
ncbi:M23 family metallopeptidase [Leptolyngbya sp. FACHB-541]|uniref:M23 family metallopeptidase n=1 Tax=Leptolyngbya sp. FACHB-541 TaxID=2692810 RepID=UPI00168539A3|nr:M23 family metallopeptidase [Leptolyngbya sp. FACHB-541]MBD1998765.1 M23 family metallopeptidase [Leptolyngbya sp. FACHB-541]